MIEFQIGAIRLFALTLSAGALLAASAMPSSAQTPQPVVPDANALSRSVFDGGDIARLQKVFAKARAGQPIVVAAIGGSITAGAKASKWSLNYCSLVGAWWQKAFPNAAITVVNAGVGATGSNYAAFRAQRDLLSKHPDFVVVEFAVNDAASTSSQPAYEGLLRQILSQQQQPAVLLLFMMHEGGGNAQGFQVPIGKHYNIPMISYRDATWPEIQAGTMKWDDIEADQVHPNDAGHAFAAKLVTSFLESAQASPSKSEASATLPAPLTTDMYQFCHLYTPDKITPTRADGWTLNDKNQFIATQPGSIFECDVEGTSISLMSWRIRGPMGKAKAQVDNEPAKVIDGWFDQTWGGFQPTDLLASDLEPGKHHVRVELLPDKDSLSTGNEFRILGIATAGASK